MPANSNNNSRYRHTLVFIDDRPESEAGRAAGVVYYGQRRPIRFRDDVDTVAHTVMDGENLAGLANTHYQGFPNPSSLWWIIAEFQPVPIIDPTRKLRGGTVLLIPSATLVARLLHGGVAGQ